MAQQTPSGADATAYNFTIRIGWPQLELGSTVTSPIRTDGSATLRGNESITVAYTPPSSSGTLYAEFMIPAKPSTGTNFTPAELDDNGGDALDRIELSTNTGAQTGSTLIRTASSVTASMSTTDTFTFGIPAKSILAYATNDVSLVLNGGTPVTDTSVTIPTTNRLRLGSRDGGSSHLNGYLRRVSYWPTRLTDAQIQGLTL